MMRELSIWADAHGSRGDYGVFRTVAELKDAGVTDTVETAGDGEDLISILGDCRFHSIDHVVIACHGGTTWLLDDEYGVTTGRPIRGGQVSVYELAEAMAPILAAKPLVSLAACLCSRSPTWWLRQKYGRSIGSDWGRRAYLPGGEASFSARLRDALWWYGVRARVRGHRAAGHASALALLAEHRWPAAEQCETLFQRALPGIEPSPLVRRWWVRNVTGELAQRWLMGDDSVEGEIWGRWARR